MNFLSAENISKSFTEKWLFKNINIGISEGQKVALVGINGCGKSTLLKVLAGKLPADSGIISFRKGITIGFLDQNPDLNPEISVYDSLFSADSETIKAVKTYEKAIESGDGDAMQKAMERIDELNAWDYDSRVKEIIAKTGLEDLQQKVGTLSGGQKKRVALAQLLIEDPQFIIMDEPTNHLDLETIEWMEEYLTQKNKTLLLVTHDRYFLDAVVNQIIELEDGNIFKYDGDYTYFLEKKAEREQIRDAEIDKARNLMRKELDWIRRQPKARGTKAKYRVDAFYELKEKAESRQIKQKLELNLQTSRLGGKIIEAEKISKSFNGKTLIKDFSYVFKKKDRIGIVGKNGAGKSTFLNMLQGLLTPDSGRIDKGQTVSFGYFSQMGMELPEDQRIIEVVKEIAEVIETSDGEKISASQFLNLFLFPPAVQYTYVSKLSGGEKKRLQMLCILVKNPNFLILDEPTNDLDLITLQVLEDFLLKFGGCLLIVSHDRYFMDKLADHLFIFEGEGKIKDFPGNYSQYREWAMEQEELERIKLEASTNLKSIKSDTSENNTSKKLSFSEKKEFEDLEKILEQLEIEKKQTTEELNSGISDHQQIALLAKKLKELSNEIESKTERWIELSEKI
ncbi:MAG: ABC transporter ATP-binding protein [Cytophagales bacterium]|nr:MAG: ABC transporter ATP-binding protein [Cytophagales bacterium]